MFISCVIIREKMQFDFIECFRKLYRCGLQYDTSLPRDVVLHALGLFGLFRIVPLVKRTNKISGNAANSFKGNAFANSLHSAAFLLKPRHIVYALFRRHDRSYRGYSIETLRGEGAGSVHARPDFELQIGSTKCRNLFQHPHCTTICCGLSRV